MGRVLAKKVVDLSWQLILTDYLRVLVHSLELHPQNVYGPGRRSTRQRLALRFKDRVSRRSLA
jgi:hypothetical protein